MELSEEGRDSVTPDRRPAVKQALVACDACHARKVKCDRRAPCGNCQDSGTECHRAREKPGRKQKEASRKEQVADVPQLHKRITSLEGSVNELLTFMKGWSSTGNARSISSRKRTGTEAFGRSESTSSPRPIRLTVPTVSAHKAQMLIQHELNRVPIVLKDKHSALCSALSFLKDSLNTEMTEDYTSGDVPSREYLESSAMPDAPLIQWMLQCTVLCGFHVAYADRFVAEDTGRGVYSKKEFMPFISRRTVAHMATDILAAPREQCDPASVVCVAAYAAYFLQEIVLSNTSKITGLETLLREQAEELFATARKWTSYLARKASPSLNNLQALSFGVMLAQEAGDFSTAWSLAKATSNICLALQLNKPGNVFTNPGTELEAYFCFAMCYMNDKGLAMNLGQPSLLPDSEMEVDILVHPRSHIPVVDNFYLYLNLANIQSFIMKDLKRSTDPEEQRQAIDNLLSKMSDIWRLKVQSEIPQSKNNSYASEMETTMIELAFFSIQTVIYQSSTETLRNLDYAQANLEAARAALFRVQKARIITRFAQYDSKYMKASFAHWTILYYPFTPFFVLFCNVVRTNHLPDFTAMQDFVAYLSEIEDISDSVAKLYKLCALFLSLITAVINSHDNIAYSTKVFNTSNNQTGDDLSQGGTPDSFAMSDTHGQTIRSAQLFGNSPNDLAMPAITAWPTSFQIDNINLENMPPYYPDPLYDEFMGRQPTLQWLDSDFSSLGDNVWARTGQYMTPP
ncbi:uncharacterized protein PAC_09279 [Phialocephala subalpina]|uniref:Zn(2)-C6 fungal-type domain-containing protein n=1 Tax=Phialocephala subalpina TaxID=576137 RepID=A0A1L7X317_9HELO|nr:uncharacterized protein PAC_09279 [Phialocephala subalpina]